MKFILGKKLGMTQVWRDDKVVPVTKVKAGPCVITQVKTGEKDSYNAVQLGFEEKKDKRTKKPQKGHFKSVGFNPRYLREFRVDEVNDDLQAGKKIDVTTFEAGDKVDATGVTKGRGFQGVIKKHGFSGASATHGTKDQHRMPGSAGAMGVGRIFPGKRMPGKMGNKTVTNRNLEIIDIDEENGVLLLKGAIAGSKTGLVLLKGEGDLKVVENKQEKEAQKESSETKQDKQVEEQNEEQNKKEDQETKANS